MDYNKLTKVKRFMKQQLGALDEIDAVVNHDTIYRKTHPELEELPTAELRQYTGLMRSACKQTLALIDRYEPLLKPAATTPTSTKGKTTAPKEEKETLGGPICAKCKTPVTPACDGALASEKRCCASCEKAKKNDCNSAQPCIKTKPERPADDALSFSFDEESVVKRCRVCGCTEDRACEGGCHWVEDDLCSACVEGGEEE